MAEDTIPATASTPAALLRNEIVRGLLYIHSRLNANTSETLDALSSLSALIDILIRKGVITPEDFEVGREAAGHRLTEQFGEKGIGVLLQENEEDKYAFSSGVAIDCENRVSLCHAVCCRLRFALSKQDVREGIVRWDLERPYSIAHDKDDQCSHLDPNSRGCTVWANRPIPCRAFDCRKDKRIWIDFERRIPNPDIGKSDWPFCTEDHPIPKTEAEKAAVRKVISLKSRDNVVPL